LWRQSFEQRRCLVPASSYCEPKGEKPWQGMHRGELADLNTQYLLDMEEQGYALVKCEGAVFKPEG
jgi:putative SOS response-associated peptidase YedK